MHFKVNVFLPMRAGSERVPNKNTKPFADLSGGLCRIKLEQLLECDSVETIFVSTDDAKVVRISEGFNSKKIKIFDRPKELSLSSTLTDDLIRYVPEIMPDCHILWTHVTSPFIGSEIYEKIIETYFKSLGQHDSLMTVTKLQKFMWYNGAPVNYDRKIEKWPRTQTIEPLWEVNSGAFLATREIYKNRLDRIGEKPFLYPLSDYTAFDIDWVQDFKLAEGLFKKI